MVKSVSVKSFSILLALALLCSMGLMASVLSSPSTAVAQPWSMYFAQTYIMEDGSENNQVWVSIMNEDQTVTDVQITNEGFEEDVEDPSIAIAPDGNIIVAWQMMGGDNDQIYYAVLDSSGAVIKGETALTSSGGETENYDPCVAVTPDGKVFIVWEYAPDGDDPVAYAILDSSGNILTTQTNISRPEDIDEPTVATSTKDATNNNVVIAWEEDDGDDYQVWFTVLGSTGNTLVAHTQVTNTDEDSETINAAILPNGNFAIVWEEYDGSDVEVWFTIRGADGGIIKGNTQVSDSPEICAEPAVAATPGGNIVIIWTEYVWEGNNNVFYTILNGSGNVVKAIAQVTLFSEEDDDNCDVAIDQNGNIVISWEDGTETVDVDRVAFAVLASDGAIVTTDLALTDGTYDVDLDGGMGTRQVATMPTSLSLLPVGGEAFSPDKQVVMAPWIALAIAIASGTAILIRRRRTAS